MGIATRQRRKRLQSPVSCLGYLTVAHLNVRGHGLGIKAMPGAFEQAGLLNGDEMNTSETNAAVLADTHSKTPKHPNVTWFAAILAAWQVKLMGAKPTAEQLSVPLYWGYRAGSEALHLAMCLRPEGCTVQQFCTAGSCGPANNKRRDVVSHRKLATVTVSGTPYAYKLVMTAKGRDALKAGIVKAAEYVAPHTSKKVDKSTPAKKAAAVHHGKRVIGPHKPKGASKPKAAVTTAIKAQNAPAATADLPAAIVAPVTVDQQVTA